MGIAIGWGLVAGCSTPEVVSVDTGAGLDAPALDAPGTDTGVRTDGGTCATDAQCDDGAFCNGAERCVTGSCQPGAAACATGVTCDEANDRCMTTACTTDADGDNHRDAACTGGDDCDDTDPLRFPGNMEHCDSTAHDEDCDPTTYGFRDGDGDGEPDATCCNVNDAGTRVCGTDCDDNRPGTNPNVPEACDGRDNDCDMAIDEGVQTIFYVDGDGDLYGVDDAATNMNACVAPAGYADRPGDCDDAVGSIHPGVADLCDPGNVDDDCNGTPNDPPGGCSCTGTDTRPCTAQGVCASGTESCNGGTWGMCSVAATAETCNGLDDDCDGTVDNGVTINCFADGDGDGYPVGGAPATPFCATSGGFGGCPTGFTTRAPVGATADCNDTALTTYPGAPDVCNGVDDDCSGMADEGLTVLCYQDVDNDGYSGVGAVAVAQCAVPSRPAVGQCPVGWTNRAPSPVDCNDVDSTRSPGAAEICDGIDQDCDGTIDDGATVQCYPDGDGDSYAASGATASAVCPDASRTMVGTCPFGTTNRAPVGLTGIDCNDMQAAISPAASEVCDAIDNDCDGTTNEGTTVVCYLDTDLDGYAGSAMAMNVCPDPTRPSVGQCPLGFTNVAGSGASLDCNDGAILVHPGATEICNGIDDDCEGGTDEGLATRWYRDADNDTYGNAAMFVDACVNPGGYVANSTDCNDGVANIHPGATEVCNGFDDDCAGGVDNGLTTSTVYRDVDGDGYGVTAMSASRCVGTPGYATVGGDCDDTRSSVHPTASEICGNGIDEDCSGVADDNTPTWYRDDDNDGYGGTNAAPLTQCAAPMTGHWVTQNGDCLDGAGYQYVYPGAPELCDGLDNDCTTVATPAEGEVPNSHGLNHPLEDNDDDGHGDATCTPPVSAATSLDDCNDTAADVYTGATEIVGNNVDNDCDTHERCYFDADNDGFSRSDAATQVSADTDCLDSGEGLASEPRTDCVDTNVSVHPGGVPVADNGFDDNCNGAHECFFDADDDGYSRSDAALRDDSVDADCLDSGEGANSEPRSDCNDTNALVSPGDVELADNALDDNCSGFYGCYYDADNDGFSRADAAVRDDSADGDCLDAGEGANSEPRTDCVDTNAAVHAGVAEIADNGLDDNCSGFYGCFVDADSDGYRPTGAAVVSDTSADNDCSGAGEGSSVEPVTDCLDSNAAVHPGATLVADNGLDDDCSGFYECYYDADNDGYSRSDGAIRNDSADNACTGSGEGATGEPRTDCNDSNAAVHPGATLVADNGLDDDCSSFYECYYDADNDNYSRSDAAIRNDSADADCLDPGEGRSTEPRTDCCDTDARAYPGELSYYGTPRTTCGGYDFNCDGASTKQYTATSTLACSYDPEIMDCIASGHEGWTSTNPSCGGSASYDADCLYNGHFCTEQSGTLTQTCR
ncbi:MAG: putative metal-binding motif-containing protein [Sandaracinus sp.]